jgi:hypothetical protein
MKKPVVLYATVYPENTASLRQLEITQNIIREGCDHPDFDLKVLIVTSQEAGAAAAGSFLPGNGVDVEIVYLDSPYRKDKGWKPKEERREEEISHCKEVLHRNICNREDYDYLWFMDSDVWCPIYTVPEMIQMLPQNCSDKFLRIPGLMRAKNLRGRLPKVNLMSFFHTRRLAHDTQYWKSVFPKQKNGSRNGAPDCHIDKFIKRTAKRVDVPCVVRHFYARDGYTEYDFGKRRIDVKCTDETAFHCSKTDFANKVAKENVFTAVHMCPGDPNANEDRIALFKELYRYKYHIAQELKPTSILDIGVRAGYSAFAFAKACPNASIVGVDNCGSDDGGKGGEDGKYLAWSQVLLSDYSYSSKKWDTLKEGIPAEVFGTYELIHVDGSRSDKGVYKDMSSSVGVLEEDGCILVNDYNYLKNVKKGVDNWLKDHEDFEGVVLDTVRGDALIRRRTEKEYPEIWQRGKSIHT